MTVVATGQITIVDNNDAKPITVFINATPGPQQVYTKDESTTSYLPDWTTANANTGIVLRAKAYIGGVSAAVDITGQLSNRRWSLDLATPIVGTAALISGNAQMAATFVQGGGFTYSVVHDGAGSSLTIKSNMLPTIALDVVYFEADYTDPVTSLVSRITASITLGLVKTGTNAVFVQTRGTTVIEGATGTVKSVVALGADLIRAAGVDATGVTYRWFEANGATQIITGAPFATKYGLKTTTGLTVPTAILGDIGQNLPAAAAWGSHNTLVIHESAVVSFGIYKVEAKDSDGVIYQSIFTINDVSDPYDCRILSTTGDKLQNGVGNSDLIPIVYYGGTLVASLTGWTFTWQFNNRNGLRGAFIDTTRTAQAGGRPISVNTSGVSGVITYGGAAITFAPGDLIKCVYPNGSERFYEVASGTGNTVTIRTPTTNTWLNFTNFPAPAAVNDLVGGVLYVCRNNGGQATTSASAPLTITGDEVDAKAMITVSADRP